MQKFEWSEYQKEIFKNAKRGKGNTAVIALAGSAKTTSLIEAVKYLPKNQKTLVVAFNKSIQEELQSRVPRNIEARTLHSLGLAAVKLKFGKDVKIDSNKNFTILDMLLGKNKTKDLSYELIKAISYCKATLTDSPSKIIELMDDYDIESEPLSKEEFATIVVKALGIAKSMVPTVIDFDDMIWAPFVYRLSIGKWDNIFVDEAQDLNYSQVVMATSAIKPEGRIFVFLDPNQAIYSFRASDFSTVNALIDGLNPTKLPLPICYRCPKKIIDLAKELVPDIQPYDKNIDGTVNYILDTELIRTVKPGEVILSRTNAPMIKYCMNFMKAGIPANIKGQDIGAGLIAFVKKSKAKNIADFIKYVNKWKLEEIKRLQKDNKKTDIILDKTDCLLGLAEEVLTIKELNDLITKLFVDIDDNKRVLFSSTHKFKGLENNNIYILNWTYRPGFDQEETNLKYVAITRSKEKLTFVNKQKSGV